MESFECTVEDVACAELGDAELDVICILVASSAGGFKGMKTFWSGFVLA